MGGGRQSVASGLARAAGRLSSDKALRKRLLRAGVSGAAMTLGAVARLMHILWLEMTGFLFICVAAIGAGEVVRKWPTHDLLKLTAAGVFSAMFLYFGVSSFWRARKPKSTTETRRAGRKA